MRVVITGMGICSAAGADVDQVRERLKAAESNIAPLTAFDTKSLKVTQGAEAKAFDPASRFTSRQRHKIDRATLMALTAAREAFDRAGLRQQEVHEDRLGLSVGVSGASAFQNVAVKLDRSIPVSKYSGLFYLRHVPHFQTEVLSRELGIHGFQTTSATASSGSAIAIGNAFRQLRAGKADVALAGGGEILTVLNAVGMSSLGLSEDEPCSPFSGREGISFGEGAGFVVLETLKHAQRRGAAIRGELLGYGESVDAYDPISNDPSGEGVYRAMQKALHDARLGSSQIGWIKASGTGNRTQDLAETAAIKQLFEKKEAVPPVSSLEPNFGHANGVSPVLGLIGALLCQQDGVIPPTLNFTEARAGCDLDYVPNTPREEPVDYFLSNAVAFGGVNAVLVMGRYPARDHGEGNEAPEESTTNGSSRSPRSDEAHVAAGRGFTEPSLGRVCITGLGVVSPVGHGHEAFRQALRAGKRGLAPVSRRFAPAGGGDGQAASDDAAGGEEAVAGLIEGFKARRHVRGVRTRRMDRVSTYATAAAGMALQDAGLMNTPSMNPERTGLFAGVSRGASVSMESYLKSVEEQKWEQASARHFPKLVMSSVGGAVSVALGLRGSSSTIVDGMGSGLQALAHGYEHFRQHPHLEALVVVAADEVGALFHRLYERLGLAGASAGAPPRPYAPEEQSAGIALGEGAAAVVLERRSAVEERGASPGGGASPKSSGGGGGSGGSGRSWAAIEGYGLTADAQGPRRLEESGRALSRAAEQALREGGARARQVGLVWGHGRGAPGYDRRELRALGRVLEEGEGALEATSEKKASEKKASAGAAAEAAPAALGCVQGQTGVSEAASGLFSVVGACLSLRHEEVYAPVGADAAAVAEESGGRLRAAETLAEDWGGSALAGSAPAGSAPAEGAHALVAGSTENGNNAALLLKKAD